MLNAPIKISAYTALFFGAAIIILETIRRWGQWDTWPAIIDDYILGSFLIFSFILFLKNKSNARLWLCAGWGMACGGFYGSTMSAYFNLMNGLPDPSHKSADIVFGVKFLLFVIALACLFVSLRNYSSDKK